MRTSVAIVMLLLGLTACDQERRSIDGEQPVTDPIGATDPRWAQYDGNVWQVAQGGRYFTWYRCGRCHGATAKDLLDLADGRWHHGGTPDRIYAAITRHGPAAAQIPSEQRWQLAAYVRQLPLLDPARRRRQDLDQTGEAQGAAWSGPIE
ncbi:mono/diheme cytochrome c family protein [Sphingomonas zeicaulis]|uniref:hypothetical protein n=1 Tax=Sphingomonas zeicaulis TaxID=1632740 RepID=UPI003D1AB74E